MEYRRLELNILSARGLKDVNLFSKMRVYAVVSLSGDSYLNQMAETAVDRDGRTDPTWNFPMKFTVNESLARQKQLTLEIKVRTKRTFHGDRDVGEVQVPVEQLLDQPGDGSFRFVSYEVRKRSANPQGTLNLSYKFEEQVRQLSTGPPMPPALNEAPGPGSRRGQPYPPPPQHAAGHGYPPPPQAGCGHPPQPGMRLGEVLGGVRSAMIVGNMVADATADAGGFDGGFDL